MKYNFKKGKKNFEIDVKTCSLFGKWKGLMFSKKEKANALLFNSVPGGIHSYFVFFDFLAVWLSPNREVIKIEKIKPWTFYIKPKGSILVEIPINKKYIKIIRELSKV